MSIRHSFLAMLAGEPAHGYGLKTSFEERTAGIWPLNAGQVYTTLSRLERDGLVEAQGDAPGRRAWSITARGREELAAWYDAPVQHSSERDELVMKVLFAVAAGESKMGRVLQTQRAATMQRLQEYTRNKMAADPGQEPAWVLLLDALILRAEAEIRWLDLCEQRLDLVREGSPS